MPQLLHRAQAGRSPKVQPPAWQPRGRTISQHHRGAESGLESSGQDALPLRKQACLKRMKMKTRLRGRTA